ncbi:Beta-monoglucosyldiacylglycerol synthase [Halomicronema hongdechloris C2206]|uniref:Beta-monoglucosyldiacylglycerol synthase n=1 Tax=Halomicronema hongdechloris C2206 TaxID=1641165 RepID=A0A1Z3HJZ8_9CYAN|nr:glycosyltransferase [Halomicronema hongdechloris]ASC70630.1 Beta-monoglucosyldiacylglycerol synthase [Halomicronema hongdechloris C2206]
MTLTPPQQSTPASPTVRLALRVRRATLAMVTTILAAAAIVIAWFAGEARISAIFNQLQAIQQDPPVWAEVPMVAGNYLLAPTVILLLLAYGITRISPRPRPWSRLVIVTILLLLVGRYLVWRSLSTLNLSTPLQGTASLILFFMEMMALLGSIIQLVLLLRVRNRQRQADQLEQDICAGRYLPSVDVLIPTYDEPDFILRRTVIGCQAMDYPRKTVYLLDDTRRPAIQALAAELGCAYLTRPDNRHAKAGNLNHAIAHTQGELIACFDADFVPTRNFLRRTPGFFQDPTVALVQTPQSFYNPDPIARNLGLEDVLTPEEEVFYRQIQPMRDGAGSVVCSGTSFVVRRSSLVATGGFVTESLSEDYFTAVRLAAQGNQVIYLDEKLSAGLAAENIAAHASQRLRWARGTLQAFFIDANPLTISGLTIWQRLGHLEGLLHWFSSIPRIVFLLMPLVYSIGVIPVQASVEEVMYFFVPYYLVQLTVFSWLNERSRSALLSDIYALVLVFPLAITVIQAMLHPFAKGFKVTPKGTANQRFRFNWSLAWPLMVLFVLTALSLWRNLGWCLDMGWSGEHLRGIALGWIWSTYNLLMVGIALLILLDVPRPDPHVWFDLRRVVRLRCQGSEQTWWGITTMMSEGGVQVELTQRGPAALQGDAPIAVTLTIAETGLTLPGQIIAGGDTGEFPCIRVQFGELPLDQRRQLIEELFCRPGQWKRWDSPGEWASLGLLFKVLFQPRILTGDIRVKALSVAKG